MRGSDIDSVPVCSDWFGASATASRTTSVLIAHSAFHVYAPSTHYFSCLRSPRARPRPSCVGLLVCTVHIKSGKTNGSFLFLRFYAHTLEQSERQMLPYQPPQTSHHHCRAARWFMKISKGETNGWMEVQGAPEHTPLPEVRYLGFCRIHWNWWWLCSVHRLNPQQAGVGRSVHFWRDVNQSSIAAAFGGWGALQLPLLPPKPDESGGLRRLNTHVKESYLEERGFFFLFSSSSGSWEPW